MSVINWEGFCFVKQRVHADRSDNNTQTETGSEGQLLQDTVGHLPFKLGDRAPFVLYLSVQKDAFVKMCHTCLDVILASLFKGALCSFGALICLYVADPVTF